MSAGIPSTMMKIALGILVEVSISGWQFVSANTKADAHSILQIDSRTSPLPHISTPWQYC